MLDAFIIEELRRREERERARAERPRLELPLHNERERPVAHDEEEATEPPPQRGVIVIDL
jgi:hypothetical protein